MTAFLLLGAGAVAAKVSPRQELLELKQKQREELRLKIKEITTAKVRERLTRMEDSMCRVNTQRTSTFTKQLAVMTKILDRVEIKTKEAKNAGKNVTEVETKIVAARQAITDAQTAVDNQSVNPCAFTITGTDSATLRANIKTGISGLQDQLSTVKNKLIIAKKAVSEAIVALARTRGEKTEVTVTP